jgi:hypothetical protein
MADYAVKVITDFGVGKKPEAIVANHKMPHKGN